MSKQQRKQIIDYIFNNPNVPAKIRRAFEEWMLTRENEAEIDEILLEMWNRHTADATIKETRLGLQRLHAAIKPGRVRMLGRRILRYAGMAAAVLLIFAGGYYFAARTVRPAEEITLLTAKGNVGEFTLPDGSRVWLNGESRLKYPAEFSGPTREVALSGEAFFEVSKDSLRPFRVNMDNDINKWLTTGLRASVARTQQTNNVDGSGAIYNALNQLPEVPARNPDGSFGMQTENMYGTYFSNPLSDLIQNENYSRNTQVYVNAFADIKLWKGLVFRTEYAANFNYSNDYKFTPSYDYEHFKQQSSASRGAGNGSNWTLKTYFTYNNTFGKHSLSAMLGHEAQENKYESLSGSRTNFLFNSVHELDAGDATTAKANSSRGSSAIESYFCLLYTSPSPRDTR